jgi:hypothetical protein
MKNHLKLTSYPIRVAAVGLLATLAAMPFAAAGISEDQALVNASPDYDAVRERLISAPALDLNFDKANLRDVIRMLATKSGIHFMSMPMQKDLDKQLVTISMKMAPFAALETLANENGIALVYDRGVWHLRPFNDSEMIARTYVIKYNTGELAETTGSGAGGSGSESGGFGGGGGGGGGFSGGSSGGGGGGSGGGMGNGLDLGAAGNIFKVDDKEMVEKVKEILGTSTSGYTANFAGEVSVDEFSNSPILVPSQAPRGEGEGGDKQGEAKVVWNSDSNTLFVVATRQQHQFVERWISSIDRKQSLIAVELKFVETTKDPKNQLGVDWSGTFDGGFKFSLNTPPTTVDLNDIGATELPTAAILTPDDVNVKLNFLLKDRETSTVSYPRVLTQNNREVSMRSVVNFPVLASSSSVSGGTGTGASTASISFLPIGTTVNILPKRINDDRVIMHTKIVVANVIGNEIIDGNSYPVPTSRVYQAPLEVQSGYTVAIAGLDEATDARAGTGIPVLSRIPVVGWAFKNRFRDRSRKNLMIFITPTIMPVDGNGVGERPISELPRFHGDQAVAAPRIHPNGELEGGAAALEQAIKWCDREERRIRNVCGEARAATPGGAFQRTEFNQLIQLGKVNYALRRYLGGLKKQGAADPAMLQLPEWNLNQIHRRTRGLWLEHFRQSLHTPGIGENTSLYFE